MGKLEFVTEEKKYTYTFKNLTFSHRKSITKGAHIGGKTMKVYGFTICGNDRCYLRTLENGKTVSQESYTSCSMDENEVIEEAYKKYSDTFRDFGFEDGCDYDGEEMLTKQEFKKIYPGSVYIQGSDEHVVFDFFSQELTNNKERI